MPRRVRLLPLIFLLSAAPLLATASSLAQPRRPGAKASPPATHVATPLPSPPPSSSATPPAPPPDASAPDAKSIDERPALSMEAKAEAAEHFEKGRNLIRVNATDAALAEFLESRRLFPTRSATFNAALCLNQLQRFDEALAMYEALLREFPEMPADIKATAQKQVIDLRALVGTVEVTGGEPGAAISVDGRTRGDYPLIEPMRVAAGSHAVRLYKEGYEPFETRVDVVGGKTVSVPVRLRALRREETGRLRVVERSGKALDVIVDGVVVGKTPQWEGALTVGPHTVILRGAGDLGTPPVLVPIRLGALAPLSLAAESLAGELQVVPTPAGAGVTIDAVPLGNGIWDGRLRTGVHTVEITAEGFLPLSRQVTLTSGKHRVFAPSLERDPSSVRWRRPSRAFVEIDAAAALVPTFGSAPAAECIAPCTVNRSTGLGGLGMLRGGYALGSGPSFGLAVGYLWAFQSVTELKATIPLVGILTPTTGNVRDTLTLSGFLLGGFAGIARGDRFPLEIRLGAGGMFGTLLDVRQLNLARIAPGIRGVSRPVNLFWGSLDVRAGIRVGEHVELSAGVSGLALVSFNPPLWRREQSDSDELYIYAGSKGAAAFPPNPMLGRVAVLLTPGLGVRYSF
jgi:PEGA domain